jgi:hypothetical protein
LSNDSNDSLNASDSSIEIVSSKKLKKIKNETKRGSSNKKKQNDELKGKF